MSTLPIPGVAVKSLPVHEDDRGSLYELIHAYEMDKFGQVYVVNDPVRGTVRAFHKHKALTDYFCITSGRAKFVLVDGEPGTDEAVMLSAVLDGRRPQLLTVPPGVWHGWMSLEDNTTLVSVADELYQHQNPDEVRVAPDTWGDVWTVKGK
jgi:dTDP-4-dehydrorhamnose 3,5-epimerase